MNEARCLGDLPSGPACVPGTGLLNSWYKQQSDFVRQLYVSSSILGAAWLLHSVSDPHHLITTGGEGHFFLKNPEGLYATDYNYNGQGMYRVAHSNSAVKCF